LKQVDHTLRRGGKVRQPRQPSAFVSLQQAGECGDTKPGTRLAEEIAPREELWVHGQSLVTAASKFKIRLATAEYAASSRTSSFSLRVASP
jgi:hypothetical protein